MNHLHQPKNGVNIMKCNPDDYRDEFKCFDLTREQEDEVIFALWEIVRMFVELGYGVNSINKVFPTLLENTDQDFMNLPE
jgi:hypothetical protein